MSKQRCWKISIFLSRFFSCENGNLYVSCFFSLETSSENRYRTFLPHSETEGCQSTRASFIFERSILEFQTTPRRRPAYQEGWKAGSIRVSPRWHNVSRISIMQNCVMSNYVFCSSTLHAGVHMTSIYRLTVLSSIPWKQKTFQKQKKR